MLPVSYTKIGGNVYQMKFEGKEKKLSIVWALKKQPFPEDITAKKYLNRDGKVLINKPKKVKRRPVYCIE
jgi:hypothetical protein